MANKEWCLQKAIEIVKAYGAFSVRVDKIGSAMLVKDQVNFPPSGPELFSTLGFSGERI